MFEICDVFRVLAGSPVTIKSKLETAVRSGTYIVPPSSAVKVLGEMLPDAVAVNVVKAREVDFAVSAGNHLHGPRQRFGPGGAGPVARHRRCPEIRRGH